MSTVPPVTNPSSIPFFFRRVLGNDSTKRGVAAALAGVLVAVVTEALWPSPPSA